MVHLRTVPNSFHARVIAARLGADGIVTQLRGSVDGPYPLGECMVYVGEDDLDTARDLLLADEVESAFDTSGEVDHLPAGRHVAWATWLIAAMLVTLWATMTMRIV